MENIIVENIIVKNIMKRAGFSLFLLRLLALFALGVTTVHAEGRNQEASHDATQETTQENMPATIVSYDRASDHLSVTVEAVSLKSLLGRIAQQSGIEVLFDDLADEPVSINIQSDSLEEGLKRILKGRNHMLRYSRDDKARLLVIGVMVLPVGEQQDRRRAKRLLVMDDEAYYRARNQLSHEQLQQIDMSSERWQARLGEMPAELRDKLEKRTASRMLKQAKREQRRAEMKKKYEQISADINTKRLARRDDMLKRLDPEERAAFEQNSEAARERMRVILQENQR